MKLFKVRQHLQGRKVIENFIEAKNENDAKKKCEKNKFMKKKLVRSKRRIQTYRHRV